MLLLGEHSPYIVLAELVVSSKPPLFHRVPGAPCTGLMVLSKPPPSVLLAGTAASAATTVSVLLEERRTLVADSRETVSFIAILGSIVDTCSCVSLRKVLDKFHTFSS